MTDAATLPPWLSQPLPNEPFSPTHRRILNAYCAELDIDAEHAQYSWMTMMEAVRWWNSGAPELYKGPTAASEALANLNTFGGWEDDEGADEYRHELAQQDHRERLARVMPDPARPGWRAPRSKHAPAIDERPAEGDDDD